ncbi:MAG: 2-polyprenyl-3-methyl-6-methoxy-1,4-benzoquinone monooxygenase [Lamprobacter sp.]|uniref:2-polyprenyl-3-methyl-6-methoxy-1,4-benzoquinone monooxygenase n=1 Tax=Lamprobacter sp. TaxID=3100796 RepID=UPI002B25D44E|nr:2-polyprenyl-3-methyl-6-methoxy-1,4-benzoquinone monooxygenase [Lamprobacter sp.]MEA3639608.1 2-polyprenyl-3-methyl-6-methoxy-1,4-benzoquinone monooxygenase [Lamprobacter sp.]
MNRRDYSPIDRALIGMDQTLRTLFGRPAVTERDHPGKRLPEVDLTEQERRHIGRLMRVNHTGEVCAQALYQGQALTARDDAVRERLERSAQEENDHLAWCEERMQELGARKSVLNPLWYAGAFAMGTAAGIAGDKWSLGFVVETERQVEDHLDEHIAQVPADDHRTRAVLDQMKIDEAHHAQVAKVAGGAELPGPIKLAMRAVSKVMTKGAYWV